MMQAWHFPPCHKCGDGDLVPLSDFGGQGAAVLYKAWVCTNPACDYNLKIRNGDVYVNEPVIDASISNQRVTHTERFRSVR